MSNRYEIREQIGKGGLGAVFKAFDTQLQREVAIKRVLSTEHVSEQEAQESATKLMAEAQTLSCLNHPNIVTIFDVGQDELGGFVVMELLKGETLDDTVERGVLTQDDFTEVVYQTMEALIAAQASNVIHRDIKPTNIMVIWQASGKFQLKILDFGLAKFSRSPSVQTMDQEESVMGSIFFMAPEQFERGELDSRTDLYQMGCVYYNALTGRYPFNGETAPQVMNSHLQHKVIPVDQVRPDLSPSICQWVMWLINRDIAHRPADARDALKHWPRNPEPPGAVPMEVLPVEGTPNVATGEVRIVRAGRGASAPPTLIVGRGPTGSAPLSTRTGSAPLSRTGSTTGRLKGGSVTGRLHGGSDATGGGRANVRKAPTLLENAKTKWILLAGAGFLVLLFMVVSSRSKAKTRANESRIFQLAAAETPAGNSSDVSLAVSFLSGGRVSASLRKDAVKVLETLEGAGVSEKIHEELKVADSMPLRITLAKALAERNHTPAVATMIDTFKSATSDEQRIQILDSVRAVADLKSVNEVLGGLSGDHTLPVRKVFEDTVLTILRKNDNPEEVVDAILTRVSTTSGNERKSLFRILGVLGGEKVKDRLHSVYTEKGDAEYQRDALVAYLNWKDRTVLGDIEEIIATTSDTALRAGAERAFVRLATQPGPEPVSDLVPIWEKAFAMAGNPNDARRLIGALIDYPQAETIALLKRWGSHATHGALAKTTAQTVQKAMAGAVGIKAGEDLKGNRARVRAPITGGASINSALSSLTAWVSPETYFVWNFQVAETGVYLVEVDQASLREEPSQFVIYLAGKTLTGESKMTGELDKFETVRLMSPVRLEADQVYTLILGAGPRVHPRMMDIGAIRLVKQEQ